MRGSLPVLQSPQPPIESVLATLLNELGAVAEGVDLVLDDYHLADGDAIAADVGVPARRTFRRRCTW